MTQDEIIEMARQTGMDYLQYLSPEAFEKVEAFAKLVAQHEREACAKLCDDLDDDIVDGLAGWQYGEAIRARDKHD